MKHNKHQNQIRIIGGSLRSRKIHFDNAAGLRPTPDSVRERLFNWLGQDLTGLKVLDLFGGSGALGLEAVSRHAAATVIVENNHRTLQNIESNIRALNIKHIQTEHSDSLTYLKHSRHTFDIVFLDPPFNWQQWQELFTLLQSCLNSQAMVYLEASELPQPPDWLEIYRQGKAGMSRFLLLHYQPANSG